jgi:hypothetical protein
LIVHDILEVSVPRRTSKVTVIDDDGRSVSEWAAGYTLVSPTMMTAVASRQFQLISAGSPDRTVIGPLMLLRGSFCP